MRGFFFWRALSLFVSGSCWILNLGASRAARRLTPLTTANRPTKSRPRTQGPLRRQWPYLLDGWWIPWPWRAIYFRGRDPWFARFATLGPGAPVSTRLLLSLLADGSQDPEEPFTWEVGILPLPWLAREFPFLRVHSWGTPKTAKKLRVYVVKKKSSRSTSSTRIFAFLIVR